MRVGGQTQARLACRISAHPRLTGALDEVLIRVLILDEVVPSALYLSSRI